jgi:hypothetical protein
MKKVLILAAVAEVATGLALLIVPSLVGQLLLGARRGHRPGCFRTRLLAGPAAGRHVDLQHSVALYLAYLGFAGGLTGVFLWPAVILHVILTALLTWAFARDKETNTQKNRPRPHG